jgi:3'(2'), 5'-bisphosphate nucleotidase
MPLLDAARDAGALIMSYYRGTHAITRKEDASPVTDADHAADRLIVERLKALTPEVPIVSEEGEKPGMSASSRFWLVDPLDGTKGFIRGSGYFTVNIALIQNIQHSSPHRGEIKRGAGEAAHVPVSPHPYPPPTGEGIPILGVIFDPANDALYWGSAQGAFCQHKGGPVTPIHARTPKAGHEVALISHSHINQATQDYLNARGVTERVPCASSIKFCWLAEGKADVYPRFGPTMEWDTAAGHAILTAAGGKVTTPEGEPFVYGKKGFTNGSFVASGG